MKTVLGAAIVALATVAVVAQEKKLGAGVTLQDATAVSALLEHPDRYVGKTIRVDGVASAVCAGNGCWAAIAEDAKPGAKSIRVKVEDGVIVIPITAKGKKVSAQGVFEVVGDDHGKEAAAEHATASHGGAASAASHEKSYHLKGTGLIIR